MSIPLVINGATFDYPVNFDEQWGIQATGWAQAVTNGMLQRQGGSFPLLSDVNFGTSFGLIAEYLKSQTTPVATTGTIRLASADPGVVFRNNANTGNLVLTTDASNNLLFNGVAVGTTTTLTDNHILVGNASNVPTDVAMSGDATIVASGALTIANGAITDAKVASGAAIAVNKLAALTPSELVVSDGSGFLASLASPSLTEIGYVAGVTSSIQAQINAIIAAGQFQSGDLKAAAYTSVPSGWLLCDGTSYATATYPTLFSAIGYVYGGSGANFNVPNMVNAVPIGAGSIAAIGVTAGAQTVTPVVNVTDPGHNHTQNSHQHITTTAISSSQTRFSATSRYGTVVVNDSNWVVGTAGVEGASNQPYEFTSGVTATNNSSTTGITAASTATSIIQPSLGVTWFIKI